MLARRLLPTLALVSFLLAGCSPTKAPQERSPLLVIGVDGAEWKVIRRLWSEGKLPHLRKLAERGASASLLTAYNSSPVIWTTIATGVKPEVHGITDFVVATPTGDVPVSSTARRVPALWNMASRAGRKVALLGWWASWPAEPVNGLVLTDRTLLPLPQTLYPATYAAELARTEAETEPDGCGFGDAGPEERDRVMARTAAKISRDGYDLTLLYIRSLDVVSHHSWKGFEPEAFPAPEHPEPPAQRDEVRRIYAAVDCAIGRVLAVAPPSANVIVLSDHGFHAAKREEIRAAVDFDVVLERLGLLKRNGGAPDLAHSKIFTYASPSFRRTKMLRFALAGRERGGTVEAAERGALTRQLDAALKRVTNRRGEPIFTLRAPLVHRGEDGDLAVVVALRALTPELLLDGRPIPGAVGEIGRLSGTHTPSTHGVFIAAGPDIDPKADLTGIHVHDMAPTLLYGMGLPVAKDFVGKARTNLFAASFRQSHPLRTIATWGQRQKDEGVSRSRSDEALLDDLRSLGYIQ